MFAELIKRNIANMKLTTRYNKSRLVQVDNHYHDRIRVLKSQYLDDPIRARVFILREGGFQELTKRNVDPLVGYNLRCNMS